MSVSRFFSQQRSAGSSPASTTPSTPTNSPVSIKPANHDGMKDQFTKLVEAGKQGHTGDVVSRRHDYEP